MLWKQIIGKMIMLLVEKCDIEQKKPKNKVKTLEESEPLEKNESTEGEHSDEKVEPMEQQQHLKVC